MNTIQATDFTNIFAIFTIFSQIISKISISQGNQPKYEPDFLQFDLSHGLPVWTNSDTGRLRTIFGRVWGIDDTVSCRNIFLPRKRIIPEHPAGCPT